jgi:hypothetical protein
MGEKAIFAGLGNIFEMDWNRQSELTAEHNCEPISTVHNLTFTIPVMLFTTYFHYIVFFVIQVAAFQEIFPVKVFKDFLFFRPRSRAVSGTASAA